jgi:hypothetical protein
MDRSSAFVTYPFCLLLPLVLAGGVALALEQEPDSATSPSSPAQKSAQEMQGIEARVAEWLRTCLADWDQATHMTKAEWRTTCRRVAAERGRFLVENPNMGTSFKGEPKTRRP